MYASAIVLSLLLLRVAVAFDPDPPLWLRAGLVTPLLAVVVWRFVIWPIGANSIPAIRVLRGPLGILIAIYGLMVLVAYARAVVYGTVPGSTAAVQLLGWTLIATLAAAVLLPGQGRNGAPDAASLLLFAVGTYVGANVLLHTFGLASPIVFQSREMGPAVVLRGLGIEASRVAFPTSAGLNGFGVVAGAGLAGGAVLAVSRSVAPARRVAALAILCLCAYALLRVDTRGAMLFAVLAVLATCGLPRQARRHLALAPALLPVLPIALLVVARVAVAHRLVEGVVRNPTEIATLTSRAIIWQRSADALRRPTVSQVVGYGLNGPAAAGLDLVPGKIQEEFLDRDQITTHSLLLQTIFDSGYLGAAMMIFLLIVALRTLLVKFDDFGDPSFLALASTLLFLVLAGATESVPTPYMVESYPIFIIILVASLQPNAPEGGDVH